MGDMIDSEKSNMAWIRSSSSLMAFILVEASVYGPPYKKDQVTFCHICYTVIIGYNEQDRPNLFDLTGVCHNVDLRSEMLIWD